MEKQMTKIALCRTSLSDVFNEASPAFDEAVSLLSKDKNITIERADAAEETIIIDAPKITVAAGSPTYRQLQKSLPGWVVLPF
jgi:hypothetical protein